MKIRLLSLFLLLGILAAGCRSSGPGRPAQTVAAFFNKYENQPGFRATDWSAGLTARLLLGRLGRMGEDSELAQALTAVRSVRVISFAPTSAKSQQLAAAGLTREVDGLLANEKYTPLPVTTEASTSTLRYSARQQGDRVQELVATGTMEGVADSFILVDVAGNFTQSQLNQLIKFLPKAVKEIPQ